jgi:recombinational DNA repair protein RecR
MFDDKKNLGKEQNADLQLQLALDQKKKLTKKLIKRVSKAMKKIRDGRMQQEKPCPISKEKRDSTHLRICKETGEICHDTTFLFSWKQCHVFLNSRKNKRKGV